MTLAATIAAARAAVGTLEVPPGSNRTPIARELTERYGPVTLANGTRISRDGQEWCATFVAWAWHRGHGWPAAWGLPVVDFYTPADRNAWRSAGLWVAPTNLVVGDHIYFDWDGNGAPDHVGLIVSDLGDAWQTVEGNIGSAVQLLRRPKASTAILGGGRTPYAPPAPTPTPIPQEDGMLTIWGHPSYANRWLIGGAVVHLSPALYARYTAAGVPEIVEAHAQTLASVLSLSATSMADLVSA